MDTGYVPALQVFDAHFDASGLGVRVAYPNKELDPAPDVGESWVRLVYQPTGCEQMTLPARPGGDFDDFGLLVIDVFVPFHEKPGLERLREVGQAARLAFIGRSDGSGNVRFEVASMAMPLALEDRWLHGQVRVQYRSRFQVN